MKHAKKILVGIAVAALIMIAFLAGRQIQERNHRDARAQRCCTLISFAIDKAESNALADAAAAQALVSNIYAAYQFCDNSVPANQLHDLWNTLMFSADSYIGREAELVNQLKTISETIKANN
ncbi:MAG: hypothetical protein E7472_00515 [Ruminococcaceae bacterium]|nr:hypothetical protein [Oscillospiraceae bacterium]